MPRALIITGEGFEDVELLYPYYRLVEAGFYVDIAAPSKGRVRGKHGYEVDATVGLDEVDPTGYDLLVLPGGRGPERARVHPRAGVVVRSFFEEGKPVAAICHGPQLLITAGVVRGRRLTSYWGIRDDLVAAGAQWVDERVVVDGNLVTARYPPDIPFWMREFMRLLERRGLLAPYPKS
ncbi:MAG: type 1 glutamine amidotransferase [Desulfurococcales archaeon]|nr:type 1 glutamine amidotransferase [Desulfurococcales archaeon]